MSGLDRSGGMTRRSRIEMVGWKPFDSSRNHSPSTLDWQTTRLGGRYTRRLDLLPLRRLLPIDSSCSSRFLGTGCEFVRTRGPSSRANSCLGGGSRWVHAGLGGREGFLGGFRFKLGCTFTPSRPSHHFFLREGGRFRVGGAVVSFTGGRDAALHFQFREGVADGAEVLVGFEGDFSGS